MARKAAKAQTEPAYTSSLVLKPSLAGHTDQLATILYAYQTGRMHHAWLLHGPKGIGKARFAAEIVARLLAQNSQQTDPDQPLDLSDPNVRLVAQGAHPDFVWLDRQGSANGKKLPKFIPAADLRAGVQSLQSTAAYGGWRIVVVDALDDLNVEGANALLKPLEEPSKKSLLLLVAHSLHAVLPTIKSRCRKLAFSPLNEADLKAVSHVSNDSELDTRLLAISQGYPGRLRALIENPEIFEAFQAFCDQTQRFAEPSKLAPSTQYNQSIAATIAALTQPQRGFFQELLEDWMSRRLHNAPEPVGLPTPSATLSLDGKAMLAELWSKSGSERAVREALNIDGTEQTIALLQGLEHVYRQGSNHTT